MSKLRAFVYVVLFAAAAFVVWQYHATDEPVEPLTERWGALRLVERVGRGALGEV